MSLLSVLLAGAGMLASGSAQAVEGDAHNHLEAADGTPLRIGRSLSYRPSMGATHRERVIAGMLGPGTRSVWDPATGAPARIWGQGVPVNNAVTNAAAAKAYAATFLATYASVLAPGSTHHDFVQVANDRDAGMRTVAFQQLAGGLPVVGGQISLRFKNDRLFMVGVEAYADLDAHVHGANSLVSHNQARQAALSWIMPEMAASASVSAVHAPSVLPLVSKRSVRFATVYEVVVEATSPLGQWHVFVDAFTGDVVARKQTYLFATANLQIDAPDRWPMGTRSNHPGIFTEVTVDGVGGETDAAGTVTWPGNATAAVTASFFGTYVDVDNQSGGDASYAFSLDPGATHAIDGNNSEFEDAQASSFVHANKVVAYARAIAAGLPALDQRMEVNVNINDTCNAFYNGDSINFFSESGMCSNTARLADVVYHEYGHHLHAVAVIPGTGQMDGALSEGVSDYLAATITNDSAMGRGFFLTDAPLRQIDPAGSEAVWPDDIAGDTHITGLIIAGALWDMRTNLIADHGQAVGVAIADNLAYQAQRRAVDIPTMYFEVLAADDDDGDLDNGTPNICAINEAFGRHGLRTVAGFSSTVSSQPPDLDGYEVSVEVVGLEASCPEDDVASSLLHWQVRGDEDTAGTLMMSDTDNVFSAELPAQTDGTVVQYRVELEVGQETFAWPRNPASTHYEMFVGNTEEIYCTDFEQDPEAEGWTHGLTAGDPGEGADDWQWGEPEGASGSNDPDAAHSGDNVYGNDLGAGNFNGSYQPNKTNFALSPTVDGGGYGAVRLQYRRWLNVEDSQFDQATIYGNATPLWVNAAGADGELHHRDQEWRFHDVDLTETLDEQNQVAVTFEIATDGGLNMGGWTVDDFCIVGWIPTACGDGVVNTGEACDDGADNSDTEPDACRTDCESARCGDGVVDSGEACDDGNDDDGDDCRNDCSPADGIDDPMDDEPPPIDSDPFVVNDGGCGCRFTTESSPAPHLVWLLALGLVAARRRSRLL